MSASSGTVTIRFDVQGNENLLKSLTTLATGANQASTGVTKLQSTINGIGVGNLGPLNNIATSVNNMGAGMTAAETKVSSFKTKLAAIGTQLGQNATSFGVATASIWGVYNAYDSLEKVQIRAHSAAVRVQTLETTLASLTERRRIAVEKGNITGGQLAVLNERIADTTQKLSVAQERNADIQQDVQEAWAGFISTVGPQAIAATGSLIQLGTVFKNTFAGGGGFINTFKSAITSIFPSLAAAKAQSLLLGSGIGNLGGAMTNTIGPITKLKGALGDMGSFLTSSKGLLLGMAGALGVAAAAAVSLFHTLSVGADVKTMNDKILTGTASIKELQKQIQDLQSLSADPFNQLEQFFFSGPLGKMIKPETTKGMSDELIKGIQAQIDVKEVGKTIQGMFDSMQPVPVGFSLDFSQMTPEIQAGLQAQMAKITAIINNPTNWAAKVDPKTGKEIFSQASVQQFTINALEPLLTNLDKSIHEGAWDSYIQRATDGLQKRIAKALTGAQALTGETGKAAMAAMQKNFALTGFEPGSATEAAFKKSLVQKAALKKANDEWLLSLAEGKNTLGAAADQTREYDAENFKLTKTFGALSGETLKNTEVRNKLLAIQDKQVNGFKEEEMNLLDVAAANDVYSAAIANLVSNQEDNVTQINNIIAQSINYTSALDDQAKNQKLISEGFRDGIIQAKGFFDNLVKGTEQEGQFNLALSEGASTLGTTSDMLGFSSTMMQQLIKDVYETSKGFDTLALASAKSTSFLQDQVLIDAEISKGMLEGTQAANDWMIAMFKSTAATEAEHTQLVKIAKDWGLDLPVGIRLTKEELYKVLQAEQETQTGTLELEKALTAQLAPAFEHFKGLFDATSMKEFSKTWKELNKSGAFQGVPKDLKSSLKDMGQDLVNINRHGQEASNVIDALLINVYGGRQKGNKSGIKAILDDLKDLPGSDQIKPVTDELERIINLPKDERTAALRNYTQVLLALEDAMKPDSPGGRAITTGEAQGILNLNKAVEDGKKPVESYTTAIGDLITHVGKLQDLDITKKGKKLGFKQGDLKAGGEAGVGLGGGISAGVEIDTSKVPEITPPKPIVFPPPDMHNITDAIAKIEVDIGSMVDFAANLVLAFPPMNIDSINEGITTAEENLGSIIDFTSGLVVTFPEPNIEALNSGLTTAEENLGSIIPFVAGLVPVFPAPNIVAVVNQTSAAKKAAATLVTDMAKLKPTFPPPNIVAVVNQTSAAKKAASTLEGHIAGLKLKFPKPDISEIEKGVDAAQKKIDSLKGTTVTNHVKTVFDNAGGNILNDVRIMSAAQGKLFTTNGEQLFRVGDNPGGKETVAMIPHDKPHEIMDRLMKMFPPITSTLTRRSSKPSWQTISGGPSGGGQRSGPTVVNVTTEVYLFPGSAQFKRYIKSIMLEGISVMPTA